MTMTTLETIRLVAALGQLVCSYGLGVVCLDVVSPGRVWWWAFWPITLPATIVQTIVDVIRDRIKKIWWKRLCEKAWAAQVEEFKQIQAQGASYRPRY